jgi:leucyl aminopeptidase (aminopeptidase T)
MTLETPDRLARTVLRQRLHVKPRENVTIEAFSSTLPWAAGFVREARRIGAHPLVLFEDEASYWAAVRDGRASLLGTPGEHEWAGLGATDVYIYFWGPSEIERRSRLAEKVRDQLTAFNARWYDVARKAGLRGARMGIAWATERNAALWGVPLERWRRQLLDASTRDPATLRPDAERVRRALSKGRTVRLRHANGTDLTLGLRQRPVHVALGEVTPASRRTRFGLLASVPDANVFTAIDEDTAEGTLVANRATAYAREPVRGGRWRFERGRLRGSGYGSGASGLRSDFRSAGTGRDRPSFLEVGLDPGLRATPLHEESELGAVTVGVGGNAGFGGATRCDFLAYLTLAGGDVDIDGRPLVRAGRIVRADR